jgi:bifunctional non-homologous end joining protein LigD
VLKLLLSEPLWALAHTPPNWSIEGVSLRFAPMPLAVLDEPFDHDGFIFELKYDGFRALAYLDSGRCRLIFRNCHEFKTFPDLCTAIGQALPGQVVLDGEIVYLGKDGCARVYDLMRRRAPQYFYAFDLLWKDGQDLRGLPLIKRKRLLKKIVKSPVLFVDHLVGRGVDLFQAVCQRDLEGIVAKASQAKILPRKPAVRPTRPHGSES